MYACLSAFGKRKFGSWNISPKLKASGLKTHLPASDETNAMLGVKSLEAYGKEYFRPKRELTTFAVDT